MLRGAAALGHAEAKRWLEELGVLPLATPPSQPWTLLTPRETCLWLANCAREGLVAVSTAGKEANPDSLAALDALAAFFAGEIDRAGLERAAVRADMAKDRLQAESGIDNEFDLLLAARAAAYVVYRISWAPLLHPLESAHSQAEGLVREVNNVFKLLGPRSNRSEAWYLDLLRDLHLWPLATRP